MLSQLFQSPILFVFWALALVIAITVHEFAHALAADRLGDPTPRLQGRLTLNPLAHLDPIGTLMILITRFGWGKPVQFDPFNLANPRRDAAVISIAGPVSNLLTATLFAFTIRAGNFFFAPHGNLVIEAILTPIIFLNVALAIFNLIPVHPLDGGKILVGLLPRDVAYEWDALLNRYGILILIFLIFPFFGTAPVTQLILPVINFIISILLP
ncbi:MAG: site-2 protease family protein [Candidatus Chisholmbacteria bacterium]|nr:site-2 protease family protein [Candidatus Chisholmbacteria bacterium]